jgi:hypothetical protein
MFVFAIIILKYFLQLFKATSFKDTLSYSVTGAMISGGWHGWGPPDDRNVESSNLFSEQTNSVVREDVGG